MARGVNKVILIGTLGDEPIVRTTSSGRTVAQLSLVTNEMRRNGETGDYTEFAEWHRVVLWNKLADIAKQYLHKGSQVYVEGKLRTRSYDKDGQKRYITEIVVDEMQMLGGGRGSSSSNQNSYGNRSDANYNQQSNNNNFQNSGNYGASLGGYGNANQSSNTYGNSVPSQNHYGNVSSLPNYGNTDNSFATNNSQPTFDMSRHNTATQEPHEPAMTTDNEFGKDDIPF